MKIYSDCLFTADLCATARQVPGLYVDQVTEIQRPRLRDRGWIVRTASTTRNRLRNSGQHGAEATPAASHDDHGQWFAGLYALDPHARIVHYTDAADFHRQTDNRFRTEPDTA